MKEELAYLEGFLKSVEAKLSNERFVQSAPAAVLEGERKKQSDAMNKIAAIKEQLG
jgi:valyl-tRNA synthetase